MKRESRGITLIALVITIIVLLILAGVAIATLTGENGILTKANEAKIKTEKAGAYEQVEIAVAGSIGTDGKLNYSDLEKNLKNIDGIDESTVPSPITQENFPITVTVDGIDVEIKETGEVQLAFNAEEWDKTASDEDCFVWGSDTEGEDGYNIVVGYTSKIYNYTKLKFPSRCKKIEIGNNSYSNSGNPDSRSFGSSVKKIELPDTVMEIGDEAFQCCDWATGKGFDELESIVIPDSVTSLGSRLFWNCKSLENVILSNSITNIEKGAFENCTSLRNITIPNSVTSIGVWAFAGCTNLTNITIPSSVENIDDVAFGSEGYEPISDTAEFNVVKNSYADTWLQQHRYGNQTINYINE